MKTTSTLVKGITLTLFLLLIIGFVFFKSNLEYQKVIEAKQIPSIEENIILDTTGTGISDNHVDSGANGPEFGKNWYHAASSKSSIVLEPGDLYYIKPLSLLEKYGLPEPFDPKRPYIIDTVSLLKIQP